MNTAEERLRAYWNSQGVPKNRQDQTIASIVAKAQPGAKVGPFTIGQKTLRPTDFTFRVTADGYMLMYKGQNIGGAGILGKYSGKRRQKQIAEYADDARREIKDLVDGRGQNRFKQIIERLDKEAQEASV